LQITFLWTKKGIFESIISILTMGYSAKLIALSIRKFRQICSSTAESRSEFYQGLLYQELPGLFLSLTSSSHI